MHFNALMSILCFSLKGYVLGIIMMAIIIILGVGITIGYFYKRYCSTRCQIYVKTHILSVLVTRWGTFTSTL